MQSYDPYRCRPRREPVFTKAEEVFDAISWTLPPTMRSHYKEAYELVGNALLQMMLPDNSERAAGDAGNSNSPDTDVPSTTEVRTN